MYVLLQAHTDKWLERSYAPNTEKEVANNPKKPFAFNSYGKTPQEQGEVLMNGHFPKAIKLLKSSMETESQNCIWMFHLLHSFSVFNKTAKKRKQNTKSQQQKEE